VRYSHLNLLKIFRLADSGIFFAGSRAGKGDAAMLMRRQETALSTGRTVLVVDNDITNLQFLSRCLQKDDCRVLTNRDGKSALKRAHHDRPDLILLEVMMPEMDGFEICRRLKTDKTLQQVPVMLMTALAGLEQKVMAFELGAVDIVSKPVQPQEVRARIQTHLRLRERIEHLETKMLRQTEKLAGVNQALNAILDHREMERRSIEQTMVANIKRYVFPYLDELDRLRTDNGAKSYANIIRANIEQLIAPVAKRLSGAYLDFTPTEIKVADLIRQNKRTKFIAERLNTSPSTVEKHRNKIRKKLNILNKKVNLATYLNSLC
jgi:DNA-binding response OmpR family regulator